MSADLKEIPEKLLQVLEQGRFRKLNRLEVPTHFGNELEIFGSPSMQLRLIKDRGQWSIELGPADLSGEWYDLQDVLSIASSSEEICSFDLHSFVQTLTGNFPKNSGDLRKLLPAPRGSKARRRNKIQRAHERNISRSKRTTKQGPEHRKPMSKVSLVEAVQKQLGGENEQG